MSGDDAFNLMAILEQLQPLSAQERENQLAQLGLTPQQLNQVRAALARTTTTDFLEQPPTLVAQVHAEAQPFDETVAATRPPTPDAVDARPIPAQVGSYRILKLLGEGGMGVVYLAEQQNPRRRVALKVIMPGFTNRSLLARFALEANVLGRLQHPGIAQVYEAGTADTGAGPQPFFAMEFVTGKTLDEYVEHAKSNLPQRLELLIKICDAVQYAHQRGVIHRDLKPINILVTDDGQPKILDFGVARVTDSDIQATTQTDIGQIIGTLPYMSPEQAGGDTDEIDTRSDVYALGVIAYELLAGRLPYDLHKRALIEAVRVIREEEPSRLSSINRTYRGDIETIVGKALEKDKDRRYTSASDFAADIKRYLNDEPIAARPPGTWYQVSKFARRNRALVGGVAATFVVLTAGIIASTSFALQAKHQAVLAESRRVEAEKQKAEAERRQKESEAVIEFINTDVFAGATPERMPDTKVRDEIVKKMLEPAAKAVRERFRDQPLVEAAVMEQIARSLEKLARGVEAEPLYKDVLERRRRALGEDHPDTITSISNYASSLVCLGRSAEAEPFHKEAMQRRRRVLGEDHPETIASIVDYAGILSSLGRFAEAESLLKDAMGRLGRILGKDDPRTITPTVRYAFLLVSLGRYAEAQPLYKDAVERSRRVLGEDHPDTVESINAYGDLSRVMGNYSEAEPLLMGALERRRRVLGDDHPDTITSAFNYAMVVYSMGRQAEAVPLFQDVLARSRRVLGQDHQNTIISINCYAVALRSLGRFSEAEPLQREALERHLSTLGEDHANTSAHILNYALVLSSLGRPSDAEPFARRAVLLATKFANPRGRQTKHRIAASTLARILVANGKSNEARAVAAEFGLPDPTTRPTTVPTTQPLSKEQDAAVREFVDRLQADWDAADRAADRAAATAPSSRPAR